MDLFSQLPPELRLKIFANTDLVPIDQTGRKTGLNIADGEPCDPQAHFMYWHTRPDECDCPAEFPTELLLDPATNPYYAEILEVAFSQNRLVFSGSPVLSLAFLQKHSQGLNHIRALEFQFEIDIIEEWAIPPRPYDSSKNSSSSQTSTLQREWEELVSSVRENLNLSKITLSLNAGISLPLYQEQRMTDKPEGDYRLRAYKNIVEPLRGLGQLNDDPKKRLKAFYVFWACYHSYEAEAEREVMGEGYVAVNKVPWQKREPSDPWWDGWDEREKERKRKEKELEKKGGDPRLYTQVGFHEEDYGDSPWQQT